MGGPLSSSGFAARPRARGRWAVSRTQGERGTLRHWLGLHGTGKKTAADGIMARSPLKPQRPVSAPAPADETPEQRLVRLEARVRELEAETTKPTTEREILRSAAKYFAGETDW
jgi:transposase